MLLREENLSNSLKPLVLFRKSNKSSTKIKKNLFLISEFFVGPVIDIYMAVGFQNQSRKI